MYNRVYLVCFHCKNEFYVDLMQLQAGADRACPNCRQPFDYVGLGLLTQGLQSLNEAAQTVNFRLEEGQQLKLVKRGIRALLQGAQEPD